MNIQMDQTADSPLKPATGDPLLGIPQEVDSGLISLQLLEFKSRLLEAVEELHIHRDAETRSQDQMSKLVLEKQELEWQKESLQRQMETMASQHAESLASVNKQFQIKLRDVEGEKGRYQLATELKDKETSSLKEELKQLQLFKYSLEKKLSELDQKLQLQSVSRGRQLSQLSEVERRFGAVSRQCTLLKQAHAKLELNVDESMRQNKKLFSLNNRKDSTIKALKRCLEELNSKVIKARVSSESRSEKTQPATEQLIQQLQHRLHVEIEMNRKLGEENAAERTAKQEVLTSLQHTQQLLLAQTQAVCRAEKELQAQREQYQSLKGEHEVMRARVDAKEARSSMLEEQSMNAGLVWGNQKPELLERLCSEQQDLSSEQQELSSEQHDLSCEQQELSSVHQELSCMQQELSSEQQELSSEQQELSSEQQELSSEQQELSSEQQELSSEQQELSRVQQELSIEQQKLSNEQQELSCMQQELSCEQQELSSEQQELSSEQQARDNLHHQHTALLSQAAPSALRTQELVKPSQNPTADRGDLSSHGSDLTAEDGYGEKPVDQTGPFHPTQKDQQDKPSDAVSSMESHIKGQTSSSQVITLPQSLSVYSSGCLNPDPGRTGEDGRHNEDKPSLLLPRPGSKDGLSPPQAGGQPGDADSLVTETVAMLDVLTRPICRAPEGQPGESNPEVRRCNTTLGERRECDSTMLCGLLDQACRSSGVATDEGPVRMQLSCSDHRSVYSGGEASSPAVKVAKDEKEEEEGGMEGADETAKPQTCTRQDPRHRGGSSSPEDVDPHDPEAPVPGLQNARPHREASRTEEEREVRMQACADSCILSPVEAQSHDGAETQQADPPQHQELDTSDKPMGHRQGVWTLSQHEPKVCQNTSPESASVTEAHQSPNPRDAEVDPGRSSPYLASPTRVDPPSLARQAVTVAGVTRQHADDDEQARSTQAESPIPAPDSDKVDVPLCVRQPADLLWESVHGEIDHLASSNKCRSAVDWAAQTRSRNKPGPPDKEAHGTPTSQKPSASDLNIRPSLPSRPSFLQGRQDSTGKVVPSEDGVLVQSGAAEECCAASSLSSLKRHQEGGWKAIREAFRDTSAEQEGPVSISVSSPGVPQRSTATGRLPWQPNISSVGGCSGLDLAVSQDAEDTQQSAIRAQITRIERFLCSDQLHAPKRRRTDLF